MLIILSIIALVLLGSSIALFIQLEKNKNSLLLKETQLEAALQDRSDVVKNYHITINEKNELIVYKGKFEQQNQQIGFLIEEKKEMEKKVNEVLEYKNRIERDFALIHQDKENLQREREEWSKDKDLKLKEISAELFTQYTEQGERVNKTVKEEIENTVKKLFENYDSVLNKVSYLDEDVKKIDIVRRALLEPSGAGNLSEITLGNILDASGLTKKESKEGAGDYMLQPAISSTSRPDAIIYLPNNTYIIIDSKSSSHFLELQAAKDNGDIENEQVFLAKIRERMNIHLGDLKKRDYVQRFEDYLVNGNEDGELRIIMVMFLQTEKMMETVRRSDPNIERKALENDIHFASPIGLMNVLHQAKSMIYRDKQSRNVEKIKEEIRQLVKNIITIDNSARDLSKSIKKSVESYDKFARVFNRSIGNRVKNLQTLGVVTQKELPAKLERCKLAEQVIDGEFVEGEEEIGTLEIEEDKNN